MSCTYNYTALQRESDHHDNFLASKILHKLGEGYNIEESALAFLIFIVDFCSLLAEILSVCDEMALRTVLKGGSFHTFGRSLAYFPSFHAEHKKFMLHIIQG